MTIAVQLVSASPELCWHICTAIAAQPDIDNYSLHDQWQQLVLWSFEAYAATTAAAVATQLLLLLVVDALDKCHGEVEVRFVLKLLSETASVRVWKLRIFVTSRPETPICLELSHIPATQRRHLILHNIEQSVVDQDLYVFFET
jgi:hypothetical protein